MKWWRNDGKRKQEQWEEGEGEGEAEAESRKQKTENRKEWTNASRNKWEMRNEKGKMENGNEQWKRAMNEIEWWFEIV